MLDMKEKSVCIIIQNSKLEILLLLRDNKPSIKFPNQWVTLGGMIEEGETPENAIKRELMEEIEVDLKRFALFKVYEWPEKTEWVYFTKLNLVPEKIDLHEGQKIKYFSKKDIEHMDLAFHDSDILKDYFKANL
jgi:8-oxo-dGTP diphosphatase